MDTKYQPHINANELAATKAPDKPRLAMIDIAKGLGILLVVLGHNRIFFDLEPNRFGDFLGAFRLPFFFFVSGVTFSIARRSVRDVAIQRADAWLKPFVMAALIGGAFKLMVGKVTIESVLLSVVYGTGFTLIWPAIWFLPHLWLLYVSTALLLTHGKRLIDSWPKRVVFLTALAIGGYLFLGLFDTPLEDVSCKSRTIFEASIFECGLPFSADILMLTGLYFLIGQFMSARVKAFQFNLPIFIVCFGIMLTLHFVFDYRIDFNQRRYDDLLISTLQALCGIYVMLCVCTWLAQVQVLKQMLVYAGSGSLFILLFHMPIQYRLTDSLGLRYGEIWPVGVFALIVSIIVPLIFWEICKRSRWLSTVFLPVKKKSVTDLSQLGVTSSIGNP
jgi:fucose 4-O-acetylase-like acetyltransferase